jgi:hypothetical protein
MKRNNIILLTIAIITLLVTIIGATYAYFSTGNMNITNVANANTVTERNNMVFDTLGGGMQLNITAANMVQAKQGNVAAENNTTLTVNFTANTDYSMVCTYDIIYEWISTDKYTTHTSGVTGKEFTIQGILASNAHVSEGTNSISSEKDLSTLSYTNYAATVVSGAQIDGTGNTMSTAVWTLSSKFYNVSQDQSALSGKTYSGRFKVANVSCTAGTVTVPGPTSYWFPTTTSTLNSSTNQYEPTYTHPATGGPVQSSGSATNHNVYIGQDSSKYYVCVTITGHEICLSQPYTQYGLTGHTLNSDLTSEQRASATQAIYQAFINAGIIDNDCDAYEFSAYCYVGDLECGVSIDGYVYCSYNDDSAYVDCAVDASGHASCEP